MFADEKQINFGEIKKHRQVPVETVRQKSEEGTNIKNTNTLKTQTEIKQTGIWNKKYLQFLTVILVKGIHQLSLMVL